MKRRRKKPDRKRVFQDSLVYLYDGMSFKEMEEILKRKPTAKNHDVFEEEVNKLNLNNKKKVLQENYPDGCLNDTGKLLRFYKSSTPSDVVTVSDVEAAAFMQWDLKKLERIKKQLRDMNLISYCLYDPEIRSYYFYLKC